MICYSKIIILNPQYIIKLKRNYRKLSIIKVILGMEKLNEVYQFINNNNFLRNEKAKKKNHAILKRLCLLATLHLLHRHFQIFHLILC